MTTNPYITVPTVGDILRNKPNRKHHNEVRVEAIDEDRVHLINTKTNRHSSPKITSVLADYDIVSPSTQPAASPPPPAQAAPTQEPAPPNNTEQETFAEVLEDASAVIDGAELAVVHGVSLYTHRADPDLVTVRDVDLAARAGLVKPRNIRAVIKGAIDDGVIELTPSNGARAEGGVGSIPRAFVVQAKIQSGNNNVMEVDEYHLNELACLVIIMRLRTPRAAQIQRSIATAIVALRKGRFSEAAKAVGSPPPPRTDWLPLYDQEAALIDQSVKEGVLDSKTAIIHKMRVMQRFTGYDLTQAPDVKVGVWNPSGSVLGGLAEGESVVITKPVDDSDCVSAEWIANKVQGASAKAVGMIARAKKIHGDDGAGRDLGVWVPVLVNTREKNQQWKYTKYSAEIILPILNDVMAMLRSVQGAKVTLREAIAAVIDYHNRRNEATQ